MKVGDEVWVKAKVEYVNPHESCDITIEGDYVPLVDVALIRKAEPKPTGKLVVEIDLETGERRLLEVDIPKYKVNQTVFVKRRDYYEKGVVDKVLPAFNDSQVYIVKFENGGHNTFAENFIVPVEEVLTHITTVYVPI